MPNSSKFPMVFQFGPHLQICHCVFTKTSLKGLHILLPWWFFVITSALDKLLVPLLMNEGIAGLMVLWKVGIWVVGLGEIRVGTEAEDPYSNTR
ncbi:conserved hypothetical protein [Ricinus communis]|uniref:Uncharacterized protein n=1 Tax=Ricinus communis TaxID=3988 RepID=B9RRH7_RICCO|nr:conserved hypothetical protein [Ricinus communis]